MDCKKVLETNTQEYAQYLIDRQKTIRAKIFQLPYQTHLRYLRLGKTLEIGCGAGRNLITCSKESVGIDHNPILIEACRRRGLQAFTTQEWPERGQSQAANFDSILIAHVAEHMKAENFVQLLKDYSRFLKTNGRIVVICPQERGYQSDSTHVEFMDFEKIASAISKASQNEKHSFQVEKQYSFPFFRSIGKFFLFNEFVVIARKQISPNS